MITGRVTILLAALLVLAACAGEGAPGSAQSAGCRRSCNRSYDVCADGSGPRRAEPGGFFGGDAVCRRQLDSCLSLCPVAAPPAKPVQPQG